MFRFPLYQTGTKLTNFKKGLICLHKNLAMVNLYYDKLFLYI